MRSDSWVLQGHVVPLDNTSESTTFDGRVYINHDRIVAITSDITGADAPDGFEDAPLVDCADACIYPGLIDLHSHIAYNALPLWTHPEQDTPFLHHDIWPGRSSYGPKVSWPAWVYAKGAPESLMTYVQVRALAGGTTTIQGWPSTNRRPANQLVRNADDQSFDDAPDPIRTSTLTLDDTALRGRAENLAEGKGFIYHCSEGLDTSIVSREFEALRKTNCLRHGLIAIHMNALEESHFHAWALQAENEGDPGPGTLVWSPFSNLWLYGETTKVPAAKAAGINVCLGTDWGPSGTKTLLGELKVARIISDQRVAEGDGSWVLSNFDLVKMVTANPGDTMSRFWNRQVGRLAPDALADIAVIARRKNDPWDNLVAAHEQDVLLVAVAGNPVYGEKKILASAGQTRMSSVKVGRKRRRVVLTEPTDKDKPVEKRKKWFLSRALKNLEAVRDDPIQAVEAPLALAGEHGPVQNEVVEDWLVIEPDMPGGSSITAGPPPPGHIVQFDPLPSMAHGSRWLRSLRNRGFHEGLLDKLNDFYES